jgi:hypothetical protein
MERIAKPQENRMNSKRLIVLSLLLFGSLWGLVELGIGELAYLNDVPRAPILTAFGVLVMVLARAVWSVPGSTLALAGIASAYKVLQHPVWGCKLAAVILVGAVFEAGFTLYERRAGARAATAGRPAAHAWRIVGLSAALTFASFVLFGYFAKYVLLNPYWMAPEKLLDYQFVQGPIAALLAVPAAWAGAAIANRLLESQGAWSRAGWLVYRAAAIGSGLAGIATALALRY